MLPPIGDPGDTAPGDLDGDGCTVAEGDGDDTLAEVHPGAEEVGGDGLDNDCRGDASGCAPTSADVRTLLTYTGEVAGDMAGSSAAGAGDVHGDGYADFAVGSPFNTDGGTDAGAAWVVLGSATPTSASLSVHIEWEGVAGEGAGGSVAGVGDIDADAYDDVDGDGASDVVFGGLLADDAGSDAGSVWLASGVGP